MTSNSAAALYPVIGVATDYETLMAAMRARAEQLRVSRMTIDEVAGLPTGYASKVLMPKPSKKLGPISFGPMLQTLCLRLIVIADDTQFDRIEHRLSVRNDNKAHSGPREWRKLKEIAQ